MSAYVYIAVVCRHIFIAAFLLVLSNFSLVRCFIPLYELLVSYFYGMYIDIWRSLLLAFSWVLRLCWYCHLVRTLIESLCCVYVYLNLFLICLYSCIGCIWWSCWAIVSHICRCLHSHCHHWMFGQGWGGVWLQCWQSYWNFSSICRNNAYLCSNLCSWALWRWWPWSLSV